MRTRNYFSKVLSLALVFVMTLCAFQPLHVFAEDVENDNVSLGISDVATPSITSIKENKLQPVDENLDLDALEVAGSISFKLSADDFIWENEAPSVLAKDIIDANNITIGYTLDRGAELFGNIDFYEPDDVENIRLDFNAPAAGESNEFEYIVYLMQDGVIAEGTRTVLKGQVLVLPSTMMARGGSSTGFLAPIDPPVAGSIAISNRTQLEAIKNNLSGNYHLTADIDLSGADWVPIGDVSSVNSCFKGIFDGQGHVIYNMKINGDREYSGLFGQIDDATIKNIGLEGTDINIIRSSGSVYAGGICGDIGRVNIAKASAIINCYNRGNVSASSTYYAYVGGICGSVGDIGTGTDSIINCYNMGDVFASVSNSTDSYSVAYAGGICGSFELAATISNCYNSGDVSASSYSLSSFQIYAYAGGICGQAETSDVSVSNCYNTGNVSASSRFAYAGGVCGLSYYSVIRDCYNMGGAYASSAPLSPSDSYSMSYAGGICGEAKIFDATITNNCYSTGEVQASSTGSSSEAYDGGICGNITYASILWTPDSTSNCYCLNLYNSSDGTQLTMIQMRDAINFVGFDFTSVWDIDPDVNNGYPYLRDLGGGNPGGGTTDPELNLDKAVKIIMDEGIYLYTAYIEDADYDVYRIENGHVIFKDDTFINEPKNDDTDYLICVATGDLVTEGAILQKAGFLHSRPFQDNLIKSRMISEIDEIRSSVATGDSDLENGMQKYSDALQSARESKWVKFSVDAFAAYATGGLSSVIKLGGDMTTTFIVNKTKDEVLETIGLKSESSSISPLEHLIAKREILYSNYIQNSMRVGRSINTSEDFNNGFLASYELAINMENMRTSYNIYDKCHNVTIKYLSKLVARTVYDSALSVIMKAFGLITNTFETDKVASSAEMFVKSLSKGSEIFAKIIDLNSDPDLTKLENEAKELTGKLNHDINNQQHMYVLGNLEVIGLAKGKALPIIDQTVVAACPVDISVYDHTGNLIGQVINNIVVQSTGLYSESPLVITIVDGDVKVFYFPFTDGYRFEITATDSGLMSYLEWRTDANGNIISESNLYNILLEDGKSFTANPPYSNIIESSTPTAPDRDRSSSSSRNSSNSTKNTAVDPLATLLEKIKAAVENAAKETPAGQPVKATVQVKNAVNVTLATLKQAADTAKKAGGSVTLHFHTMSADGQTVNARIYIKPELATSDISVSMNTTRAENVKLLFEKYFKNKLAVLSFEQQGSFGMQVEIAAKVDLTGMDSKNLYLYSYDKKANTYRRIEKPAYRIDKNGYLHFTTELAGDIIVSERPLEKK